MSLEETSKLLAESRKVIEDSSNNVDNAPMLFNMVLRIVNSIDSRLKTIESGTQTINEIRKDLLLISSKERNLEKVITETKMAQHTQLAHYVFTTLQFGCCLVRSLSYVKITLSHVFQIRDMQVVVTTYFPTFLLRTDMVLMLT